MADTTVRAMDPLGVIAIANALEVMDKPEPIGCPGNCGCNPMCGCENKPGCCEDKCGCEKKQTKIDILTTVSNPGFREVIQGLDTRNIKTTSDFLAVVGEIRTKMDAINVQPRAIETNRS